MFHAFHIDFMYLTGVLIGSWDCLCPLWLVRVITQYGVIWSQVLEPSVFFFIMLTGATNIKCRDCGSVPLKTTLLSPLVNIVCWGTRGYHKFSWSSLTSSCVKFSGWKWCPRRSRQSWQPRPSGCPGPKRWHWSTWYTRRKGDDRLTKFCSSNQGLKSLGHKLSAFYNWSFTTGLLSFSKLVHPPQQIQCWKRGVLK